jgi:hypothetical protein
LFTAVLRHLSKMNSFSSQADGKGDFGDVDEIRRQNP